MTRQPPPKATKISAPTNSKSLPESFQLIVDCKTEQRQKQLYEQLTKTGWPCRLFTL